MFDQFEGYGGLDFNTEVQSIANALYLHYYNHPSSPELIWGFDATPDGEVSTVAIGCAVPADNVADKFNAIEYIDLKNATHDRTATGLGAALGIAEALNGGYLAMVARLRRLGLLPV